MTTYGTPRWRTAAARAAICAAPPVSSRSATSGCSRISSRSAISGSQHAVANLHPAFVDDPRVPACILGMQLAADAGDPLALEPVRDRLAGLRVLGQLDDEMVADRQAVAGRQRPHLDPLEGEVLAERARERLVAIGRDPRDALERIERDGLVRS